MTFKEAKLHSFETINSGPVAGAEGAAEISRAFGLGDLVTADVGGTSFDTSLIQNGRAPLLYRGEIADMPIQSPWVDVRSIGSGGGSVAYVDAGGLLQVGPESAGANPGPACYGRGGARPTTTDAVFFLGMLGAGKLSSGLSLSRDRASDALATIAEPLGYSIEEAAIGIIRIACSDMANAIREITIERGVDPRELKLLPFGGAGPMLATQIARELDIHTIVIPPYAGNFSAWGLLGSNLVRSSARTKLFQLDEAGVKAIENDLKEMFYELHARSDNVLLSDDSVLEVSLGLRFQGQEHELTIPINYEDGKVVSSIVEIEDAFRNSYHRSFDLLLENSIEVIVVRAQIRVVLARDVAAPSDDSSCVEEEQVEPAFSFFLSRTMPFETRKRKDLSVGERYNGPAIIYEPTTTTYIDSDFSYWVDDNGCLWLEQEGE